MKAKKLQILKTVIFIILVIIVFYIAFITKNKGSNQDNLKNLGIENIPSENSGHSATGEITIEVQ